MALEQGRSIVWNQLAEELEQLARSLENASYPAPDPAEANLSRWIPDQVAQKHRLEAEKWDQPVARAQSLSGTHNFLRPKTAEELVAAARAGHFVIINMDEKVGCVALIIRPGSSDITGFRFSGLSDEEAVKARSALSSPGQRQSHVEWTVTNRRSGNSLSFLPLHAAGDYRKQSCSLFN
ncbi:hypothetical protein FS749_011910 [Ceratobasidium sp. UAMH 11750]|nr:hypothetical protein FS749_011910 [Ceratobasidium sp. UAMH 11750]